MRALLLVCLSALLVSCATVQGLQVDKGEPSGQGVWHRVMEGQTLWRIGKTYRVSIDELKEANDLVDTVHVAEGTWLFIPKADRVLYVQGSVTSLAPEQAKLDFVWPAKGEVVRTFGKYKNDFNYGIDLKTNGSKSVVASEKGKVILSGAIRGYGDTIIIEHEHDFCSLYATGIESLVKEGQKVEKNSVIARVEQAKGTGGGEVLHYELFYKGKPVNPLYYLP